MWLTSNNGSTVDTSLNLHKARGLPDRCGTSQYEEGALGEKHRLPPVVPAGSKGCSTQLAARLAKGGEGKPGPLPSATLRKKKEWPLGLERWSLKLAFIGSALVADARLNTRPASRNLYRHFGWYCR